MSVGISLADLLKIVNGCIWLQQRFEKNNSADERLGQFLNDINILQRRLGRLKDALNDALEQYEDPDIDIDARNFRCDLHSLIGDIEQTIIEATELANRHIDIKRNAAGFIHNVIWAAHAEPKVDVLRKAMQFHAQKIFLVMEPVKDRQLRTIDGKMDEMLEKIDILLGNPQYVLPPLPDWLDSRFTEEIFKNQPTPFNQLSEIPLSTGFDALYLHYRGSTAFWDQETAEQTVEQYLNLLKCQWLLDILRKSLQQRRTSSLYPRVLKQMETKLIKEHQRRDITRFNDTELRNAGATAFQVWIVEQEVADIGGPPEYSSSPEHVILRLRPPNALAGEDDGVVIFRTGPTTLRIARRAPERHGINCYESEHYNIHQDVFIPFYAIADPPAPRRHSTATIPSQTVSMSINRGNGTGSINYALSGDANILAFQRAITGYQVVFDKKVKWAIKRSGAFRMPSWEEGRMQIWHWKPLEEQASPSNQPLANRPLASPTDSVFSEGSRASSTSDAVVEKLLGGRDTSIYSLDERSLAGSVISATTPPHPVIIIYGRRNEVYTYYHLELDFGLGINPSTCDCETESKKLVHDQKCDRSVIERRGEERSFTIRTMTADRSNLNTWNLGIFAQPRHPLFKNERICQHINTKFLSFKFTTVADRIDFVAKFENALRLRNKAEKEFQRIVKDTEYLESIGATSCSSSTGRSREIENAIVSLLATNSMLVPVYKEALELVSKERFTNNFRRILRAFHTDLKQFDRTLVTQELAIILRSQEVRNRMATKIIDKFISHQNSLSEQDPRQFHDSDDTNLSYLEAWLARNNVPPLLLEDAPGQTEFNFHEESILHKAEISGKSDYEVDNHDIFDSEKEGVDEEERKEYIRDVDIARFPRIDLVMQNLVEDQPFQNMIVGLKEFLLPSGLLRDILPIPRKNITYESKGRPGMLSKMQALIEDLTDLEWDWWPLPPRMSSLNEGDTRVIWRCLCGIVRYRTLKAAQKRILEDILQEPPAISQRPLFCTLLMSPTAQTNSHLALGSQPQSTSLPRSGSAASAALSPSPMSSDPISLSGDSVNSVQTSGTSLRPGHTIPSQNGYQQKKPLWFIFKIEGSRNFLDWDQFGDEGLATDRLFQQRLKRRHNELRGRFRLWFSYWRLSYWEFVKLQKTRPGRLVDRGIDLPETSDYEYSPRPPKISAEEPWISRHEFEEIVKSCITPCWLDCLPTALRFHDCACPDPDAKRLISALPKRDSKFMVNDSCDGEDYVWGIHARYVVSALYVVWIHMAILAITLSLWIWWQKKHPDDLQGASVPLTVAGICISTFWASTGILKGLR